jgi:HD-like signal output (HDOD) protein
MIGRKKDLRDRAMRVMAKLPALSAGASAFLAVLAKRDTDHDQFVATIRRDPMLAPRVLALANSGAFGRLHSVESISRAVVLLGPSTLRRYGLRWTVAGILKGLPDLPGWSTSRYRMHGEATALLADILCDHLPIGKHGDGAFIAGLVHDVGKFAICAEASESIDYIMMMRQANPQSVCAIERTVLGIDHAEISSMAAEKWKLGDDVCQAIHFHHEPDLDSNPDKTALSMVLSKSDSLVNGLGLNFLSPPCDASKGLTWPGYDDQVSQALRSFESSLQADGVVV